MALLNHLNLYGMAQKKKKKKSNAKARKALNEKKFIIEKARKLPLYGCYIEDLRDDIGEVTVMVARERSNGNLCVGIYDCDTWCFGVKDAYGLHDISKEEFKKDFIDGNSDIKECDYAYAHNLIYGAEAFAGDAGLSPGGEFGLWSHVLEEDTEDIPLIELEFGYEGKYRIECEKGDKEAMYAYGLKKRLGDDFTFDIGYGEGILDEDDDWDEDEDDWNEEDDWDEDDEEDEAYSLWAQAVAESSPEALLQIFGNLKTGLDKANAEDDRLPDEKYSYERPHYPDKLDIKHKFIADEFRKPTNSLALPTKVIDRILSLPKEEVIEDISKIVMHTIGKTWHPIDDKTLEWNHDDTIIHSLAFLIELDDEAGLEAVLEVLRQDQAFLEFHFGDAWGMILPQALYATGRNHPEILEEFLRHPGYDGYAKSFVAEALSFIAQEEPKRRGEIIDIFRRYLSFMQENIPTANGCSGYVAGSIMSNLIDLKATELLPEIKRLFDSGFVNLSICGDYEEVVQEMEMDRAPLEYFDFTDIKDFYRRLQRAFRH